MSTNLEDGHLNALKNSIAREMFRDTADQNYALARYCFYSKLNTDFYWLALHSIEKYSKCALLVNGYSSKGFGHDIEKLYTALNAFADDYLIKNFKNTFSTNEDIWFKENPVDFVKRINNLGHPENRYNSYGYSRNPMDIQKLDQLVFSIRSLCFPLKYVFDQMGNDGHGITYGALLTKNVKNWTLSFDHTSPLAKIKTGAFGETLKSALLNNNYSFADDNYEHPPFYYSTSSHNPVLLRRINWPLKNPTPENIELSQNLFDWVKSNIQISPELKREMHGWFETKPDQKQA